MKVYIDKCFVHRFWSIRNEKEILNSFYNSFLKKLNGCTIVTNFLSFDEIRENDNSELFFDILFEYSLDINFSPDLFDTSNIIKETSKGGFKIFFVELANVIIEELEKKTGYVFISTENIEKEWLFINNYKNVEKLLCLPAGNDSDSFNGWEDLKFISKIPSSSIIILDKYILSNNSNNRISDNLIPLIEQILPERYEGVVNVMIISEDILSKTTNLKKAAKDILNILDLHFNKLNPKLKFTIVHHNKAFYPSESVEMHDRYVYTNYFTIDCQRGFSLFKKGKRIIANSSVEIYFNFQHPKTKMLKTHIQGVKDYISKMKRLETYYEIFKSYPEEFECSLLK